METHPVAPYRSGDSRFPWVSEQSINGVPIRLMMLSNRSENWYSDAVAANSHYLDLISPGHVVLDIGANEGVLSVLAAMKAGRSGKVIAVEPAAHNWEPIRINAAMNGLADRIRLERKAISDTAGVVAFRGEIIGSGEPVEAVTLDDFISDAPDVIKCDCEGAEAKVFRGGRELLKRFKPIIFLETHLDGQSGGVDMRAFGDQPEDLYNLMTELGYVFYKDGNTVDVLPSGACILRHKDKLAPPIMKMPKMVCLTLKANALKKQRAMEEFARAGLEVEFFNGFDNRRAMLGSNVIGRDGNYVKCGQIGCAISHVMLWEWLMHTEHEEIIIFEDDVLLPPEFLDTFWKAYHELPDDWEIVFLGTDQIEHKEKEHLTGRVGRVQKPYGTQAYMVRRSALPVLRATNEIICTHVDLNIGWEALPLLRHYAFLPSLVKQASAEHEIRK